MISLIAVLCAGVLCGYLLRGAQCLQRLGQPITATVLLLLFLMGALVGGNRALLSNLWGLGAQACLLALASTMGSVLMAAVVWHFFFKKQASK